MLIIVQTYSLKSFGTELAFCVVYSEAYVSNDMGTHDETRTIEGMAQTQTHA